MRHHFQLCSVCPCQEDLGYLWCLCVTSWPYAPDDQWALAAGLAADILFSRRSHQQSFLQLFLSVLAYSVNSSYSCPKFVHSVLWFPLSPNRAVRVSFVFLFSSFKLWNGLSCKILKKWKWPSTSHFWNARSFAVFCLWSRQACHVDLFRKHCWRVKVALRTSRPDKSARGLLYLHCVVFLVNFSWPVSWGNFTEFQKE